MMSFCREGHQIRKRAVLDGQCTVFGVYVEGLFAIPVLVYFSPDLKPVYLTSRKSLESFL